MTILDFASNYVQKKFLTLELPGKLIRAFSGSDRHCHTVLPKSIKFTVPSRVYVLHVSLRADQH